MSHSSMSIYREKIAEKLTILNDRAVGMLTRMFNIKKACDDANVRPSCLGGPYDASIKAIVRKFPSIDIKNSAKEFTYVKSNRSEIIKQLSIYYYTFVDILDLKEHIGTLMTAIDVLRIRFNIMVNFDVTRLYLDLISNFFSLMMLVAKVDRRKAIVGLFSYAYEYEKGETDSNYHRLGTMIVEFENPVKKFCEDFHTHIAVLFPAIGSVMDYLLDSPRLQTATAWRTSQLMSLVADPQIIISPVPCKYTAQLEFFPLDTMEKWVAICGLFIVSGTEDQQLVSKWLTILQKSYIYTIFRDVVFDIQEDVLNIRGYINNKRRKDVKDAFRKAETVEPALRKDRRLYLIQILKELSLIITDEAGLIAPKLINVLMALTYARDEVLWLLKHSVNPAPRKKTSDYNENFNEPKLAELLFYMEELKALLRKYNNVLLKYYVQYLSGFDHGVLKATTGNMTVCPEQESSMISTFLETLSNLDVQQVDDQTPFDLKALRLDWLRMQVYCSAEASMIDLFAQSNLNMCSYMNLACWHSRVLDDLENLIMETGDLSMFCYMKETTGSHFLYCLNNCPRFSIVFVLLANQFIDTTHSLCPEERQHIGKRSLEDADSFLQRLAEQASKIVFEVCDIQIEYQEELSPKVVAQKTYQQLNQARSNRNRPGARPAINTPGQESYIRRRDQSDSKIDQKMTELSEICYSINYKNTIQVFEHSMCPREYFHTRLEADFMTAISRKLIKQKCIIRPSDLLNQIKAIMHVLQSLESFVLLDVSRLFNSVLLQQTQSIDSNGQQTIAYFYCQWYLDTFLSTVLNGIAVYSEHFFCFRTRDVPVKDEMGPHVPMEEYTDISELTALAELIGPFGIRYICDVFYTKICVESFANLRRLVKGNANMLQQIYALYQYPEKMVKECRGLSDPDAFLGSLKSIGVVLSFSHLLQSALKTVLKKKVPFLMTSIENFKDHDNPNKQTMAVQELAAAAGIESDIDPVLYHSFIVSQKLKYEKSDEEHKLASYMLLFAAFSLPMLALQPSSSYEYKYEAASNNAMCIARAINVLANTLFFYHGRDDIETRMREFLSLFASCALRMNSYPQPNQKIFPRAKNTVYLILHQIVENCEHLTMDMLESCFPYILIRDAFHDCHKVSHPRPLPRN